MTSYNRYSHHARRALTHAAALVNRYHHAGTDTAHLLVGVMLSEGSIGYKVLYDLNLNSTRAEPLLEEMSITGEEPLNANSNSLEAALKLAEDESNWLGHHYIGTEHMLLAITRSNLGHASALFKALEVSPEEVRRQVRHVLSDGLTEFTLQIAKRNASLSELSRRVISAAEQIAVALDHPTVGLGHLLLVLLMEKRSPTSDLLWETGLDESRLRWGLDKKAEPTLVSIETVLGQALEQAERMGSHYTGTEHLLLTFTVNPAGKLLLEMYGVSPTELHQRLEDKLAKKR